MRRLIDLDPQDPRRGLAIDEALLEAGHRNGRDAIRLWVNGRAVVVGRSQRVRDEVDLDFARRYNVPALRRISGGGTVYHYPGNLNVSVVLHDGRRMGSVRETFRRFGGAVAGALGRIEPAIVSEGNCLLLRGAKAGGAAQARRGDALLYHTTLLVRSADLPMERLLLAMRPGYRPGRVPSRPRPTVSLEEAVGGDVPMDEVVARVLRALSDLVGGSPREGRLTAAESARADRLAREKYGDRAWNRTV